ncbi:MAG: hypothetical protein CVU29_03685 [Betaproteobacteria bacterium HGW-Betaproteobacteria-22]|nr:MAG: hypothetical protein CVU29_03685 [Betaproteobacteria bacterium HGW-Betaproteobacteria-22]
MKCNVLYKVNMPVSIENYHLEHAFRMAVQKPDKRPGLLIQHPELTTALEFYEKSERCFDDQDNCALHKKTVLEALTNNICNQLREAGFKSFS